MSSSFFAQRPHARAIAGTSRSTPPRTPHIPPCTGHGACSGASSMECMSHSPSSHARTAARSRRLSSESESRNITRSADRTAREALKAAFGYMAAPTAEEDSQS
mgnify:CR=1 FL=1|jgi:hypothetical protein